jgi:uncharacterized protein (TIGR02231 family)
MQSRRIEKISKQTLQPSREVIEMQNRIGRMTTWASVVVVMGLLLLYSGTALSAPREVTLFPDSAQVMETTKVKLQTEGKYLKKAVFVLPAQADPDSLVTQVPEGLKLKIEDQTWRQIVRQDDGEILKLRKQVEKVRNDRRSLQAAIQSLNTQIQFWQLQTKAKMKTLNDTHNMSAAIGRNMKKTYEDKLNRELELEKMDKIIKELQEELDRTVGKKETAWEVAVLLSGTQATEATLTYTYSMTGCGWLPLYRLEARPKQKKIVFSWEAEVWQSSGQDWHQVITNLATLKPPPSIRPSDIPHWIIKPLYAMPRKMEKKSARAKGVEDLTMAVGSADEALAQSAPQESRQSTYAVWRVGRKNLPAGSRQRVKLQEEAWPSEFAYLIRPSLSPRAFVRALIRLPEAKEIPSGSATFLIDGAILGKRNFSFAGQEETLFFGTDPLVTAERTLLSKKSGEKGVFTDKQTYAWDWRIDVRNLKDESALVMIEEPNPQSRDQRIKMTLKLDPEPSDIKPSSLIWNLDIPAGQKKIISSSASLEAPGDMKIDLGSQR